VLVTVLSDSLCERIEKWEIRPILKEDILLGADLAGASVTKPATLLSLYKHTRIMRRQHQRRGKVDKNEHRKSSLYIEKDYFEKSQKH
jgi:hypothetical protein